MTAATRPAGGTQARAERTRAAIMDEAVRCVVEEGFEAASAKHVAERAGVTWGVIQYHFGDRDGLLTAVVDAGFDELRATMATVDVPTGTTGQRVRAIVDAAWTAFSTDTSRASLEILVATRSRRDRSTNDHLVTMAAELARLGQDLLGDRRPTAGATATAIGDLLWATLRGLVLARMVAGTPIDSSREREALIELLTVQLDHTSPKQRRGGRRADRRPSLHHVVFCVEPDHREAAQAFWTDLGFELGEIVLDDVGLLVLLDWYRGIEIITPSDVTASEGRRVRDHLDAHGEGVYTVVVFTDDIDAAVSVADRYGSSALLRQDRGGDGFELEEVMLAPIHGMPVTLIATDLP